MNLQPAHRYQTPPHKPDCDCLDCERIRRIQSDAYGVGHIDGYHKGRDAGSQEVQRRYEERTPYEMGQ